MRKYVCSVCGYTYDEAKGIPEAGIAPGTKWEDLPDDWACPLCGASKEAFKLQGGSEPVKTGVAPIQVSSDMKELTPLEMSIVCSNLARACEKQYKAEEMGLFMQLADYFKLASAPAQNPDMNQLMQLVEKDLGENIPNANAAAGEVNDRGAKRVLVWNEKVTNILKSLLTRYEKEGEAMLKNTGVYICTVCGFIFIGENPPALCPVCKVPSFKFEKIQGRE